MSELPEGWTVVDLDQVIRDCQSGFASGKKDVQDGVPHLRMNNIGVNGELVLDLVRTVPESLARSNYDLETGDVVVCTTNSSKLVGKCAQFKLEGRYAFSNHLTRLRPLDGLIIGSYLARQLWLIWQRGKFEDKRKQWVNQSTLPKEALLSAAILLPPLAEQRRIVAKLEPLLSSIDAYQQRFAKIPVVLKRFRQAVLAAACSGRLTVGWRNENSSAEPYQLPEINDPDTDIDLPSTWQSTKLGNLTTLVTSGSRGWAEYYADSGSMFIRAQNINSDYLNLDDIAYVDLPDKTEGKRTKVRQYDLLITITGANVTKSALVETSIEDAYVSQHVALVRLADQRLSKFVFYWIISIEHGRKQLQESAYGAGKPGLNLDNIREVSVAIPPLAEQQEIVRHVETLFKLVDQIEARYQRAKPLVDKLQQSILAKAFRGELVPTEAELARREGRDYEPASVLLERIKSERAEHAQGWKEKVRSQPRRARLARGAKPHI